MGCLLAYVISFAAVFSVPAAPVGVTVLSDLGCASTSIQQDWDERGLTTVQLKDSGRAYVACPGGEEQKVSCLPQECHGEPWCFVENYCGGWLWACSKLANFDLRCPKPVPPPEVKPLSAWALLGLTNYTLADGHDADWFSHADVYAKITLQPSGRSYTSDVRFNANRGNLDFHLYVLRTEEFAEVELYDKDTWTSDDLIGDFSVKIWGDEGTFDKGVVAAESHKHVGVEGYLATGEELERRAALLSMRGRAPLFGHPDQVYAMAVIPNSRVEHELAYARTGSVVPEGLHGIWWMDQRGTHLPVPGDPSYKQECASAADEVLVTWGEGNWDEEALCFRDAFVSYGSPNKGMRTFMNNGDNTNVDWIVTNTTGSKADFCFTDATFQKIELTLYARVGGVLESFLGYALPESVDGYVAVPRSIMSLNMNRKPWGWDRETVLGPDARKLRGVLSGDWFQWLDYANFICHYPVFQVVDGNGERTEHYDAYLAFANTNYPQCAGENRGFDCPWNVGNGTSLVGRLAVG